MNNALYTADDVRIETKRLVAEVTETEPEEIADTDSFATHLDLDSLMALEVMVSLSKKYKIEIPEEKFDGLENVNDVVALVIEYLEKGAEVPQAKAS